MVWTRRGKGFLVSESACQATEQRSKHALILPPRASLEWHHRTGGKHAQPLSKDFATSSDKLARSVTMREQSVS